MRSEDRERWARERLVKAINKVEDQDARREIWDAWQAHNMAAATSREGEIEPRHPTYGTLEELLGSVRADVKRGYLPRIGHHGALAWFATEYGRLKPEEETR